LTFIKICETRSFTAAADELHITQAAASNHIRKLEAELGTGRLFRGWATSS
jgi:DNA-binding transcriptional LysR family regulator